MIEKLVDYVTLSSIALVDLIALSQNTLQIWLHFLIEYFVENVNLLSSTLQIMLPYCRVHCRECYLVIEYIVENVTLLSSTLQRMLPYYRVHCRECFLIIKCIVENVTLLSSVLQIRLTYHYFVKYFILSSSTLQRMLPYYRVHCRVCCLTVLSSTLQSMLPYYRVSGRILAAFP